MAAFSPSFSRVIWYRGGTDRGSWMPVLTRFATVEAAESQVAELERMGYPAMIWHETALPEGAPVWWDFGRLTRRPSAQVGG